MADTKTVVSDGVLSEKTLTFAGSGTLLIMKKSVKRILMAVGVLLLALPAVSAPEAAKRFKLVIDAGHGGHDAGAVGAFSKEKNINLSIALAFGKLVEANCPDVTVIYTRKTDKFVPLQERADIANRAGADLFISVHTNALPGGKIAYGSETYTLGMARAAANLDVAKRENSVILYEEDYKTRYSGFDPNSAESYIIFEFIQDQYMRQSVSLARSIQRAYVRTAGRKDKGVHQAGFLVLRNTSMPSVLTEVGFISTPAEERFLNTKEGVAKMGRSIYEGFLEYRRAQGGTGALLRPFDDGGAKKSSPKAPRGAKHRDARADVEAETRVAESAAPPAGADNIPAQGEKTGRLTEETGTAADKPGRLTADAPRTAAGRVEYRVQLIASSRKLAKSDASFKGLAPVSYYEEGGLYKYTYGSTGDYNEALRLQREARKAVAGAFVVAFVDGKRVSVAEARRAATSK